VDDDTGKATTLGACVAAYERDTPMLFKHTNYVNGQTDGRRGRQMVLTSVATIGNYDYAFEYIFDMDGVIRVMVRLTGIIQARGVTSTKYDATCIDSCLTLINNHLIASVHQHFFNYRLDFDIDGPLNFATEVDITNDPSHPTNPDGGAFSARPTIIKRETTRDFNVRASRSWHVVNGNSRNKFGTPRGYALIPKDMGYPYMHLGNPYLSQASFVSHPFWVTAYKDAEQAAAGNFPRTGTPFQGLPKFVENKESLENTDLVVWYTLGITHTTTAEEWPIMNVHNAGFELLPYNFLSQNPEVPLAGVH